MLIIPKPIWAPEYGSTIWPKASTPIQPKLSIKSCKSNEPILSEGQGPHSRDWFTYGLSVLSLPGKSALSKTMVVQSLRRLCARQSLREYHRRACLLKWEPFPKPLSSKIHLKLTILVTNVIMITPLLSSYKYEKLEEEKGCWKVPKQVESKERREREKWFHWVTLPRTTQARKSKLTIQISYELKTSPAQRPYVGDAQKWICLFA